MSIIDHLILNVNDVPSSVDFYVKVLGFQLEGEEGPFTVLRVDEKELYFAVRTLGHEGR